MNATERLAHAVELTAEYGPTDNTRQMLRAALKDFAAECGDRPAPAVTPERLRYLEACEREADEWRHLHVANPGYVSHHEGCVREARAARDAARKDVP